MHVFVRVHMIAGERMHVTHCTPAWWTPGCGDNDAALLLPGSPRAGAPSPALPASKPAAMAREGGAWAMGEAPYLPTRRTCWAACKAPRADGSAQGVTEEAHCMVHTSQMASCRMASCGNVWRTRRRDRVVVKTCGSGRAV